MPLHLPNAVKSGQKSPLARVSASDLSVNKTTTFGRGPGLWRVRDDRHSGNLLERLRLLRDSGEFTDITFTYDGESINANRVVLAAVSPVMRNVFTKRENLMNAEVLPPEALHHLVRFIYSSSAEVSYDVMKQIEQASRVLQMTIVAKMCSNVLSSMADISVSETPTRRKNRPPLKRANSFEQTTTEEGARLSRQLSTEKESSSEEGIETESRNVLFGGIKRDQHSSIKLTFHSESGTPINRSTEDLNKLSDVDSIGSGIMVKAETDLNDGSKEDEQKTENVKPENLPKINLEVLEEKHGSKDKSWDEKRKLFNLSKSLDDSAFDDDSNPENNEKKLKKPIPLSKFLLSSISNLSSVESSIQKATAGQSPSNGTWPKSAKTSPRGRNIPKQWRKTKGQASSSELSNYDNVPNSQNVSKHVIGPKKSRDILTIGFKSKSIPNLLKGLNSLREQSQFCDLTLTVLNTKIQCHRVVLAASSDVFHAILRKINSKEIELRKIDEGALQEMIRFIYTGQCSIDKDNVMGVMRGSRRFHLHVIAKKCARYLNENVSSYNFFTSENVLVAYKMAGEFGFPKLREESKKFAISRFWEIIDSQCFKDLTPIELNRLISSESLRLGRFRDRDQELQFFQGLLQWLLHKPKTRVPHLTPGVMKFINFSNMTITSLNRVVAKEPVVMQDDETRQRILEVLRNSTASCKRSQSMQLKSSPFNEMAMRRNSLLHNDVFAFVTENDEESSKRINKLYNLSASMGNAIVVTSSPILWSGHSMTSYNGTLYIAGGRDAKKNKRICSDVYKYDKEGWTQLPNMRVARSHFSLVALDGVLYAIGGLSENLDKQYIATTSCERLELDAQRGNQKWKLAALSLPGPSYSHESVTCFITSSSIIANTLCPQNKIEGKRKPPGSPLRKRALRINPTLNETKSPLLIRGSPRQSSLKFGKPDPAQSQSNLQEVIFVCGGKCNPRQNLMLSTMDGGKFVEKSSLPCPSTRLSLTSVDSTVYFACDDVMETSQFRVFAYKADHDQWFEMKIPILIANPQPSSNMEVSAKGNKPTFLSTINCIATTTGFVLAVSAGDIITSTSYNVTSSTWTPNKKIILKSSIVDFSLCSM